MLKVKLGIIPVFFGSTSKTEYSLEKTTRAISDVKLVLRFKCNISNHSHKNM